MVLNKKRILICVVLVVAFLLTSILMVSSINLFSMSKKSLNVDSRKLSDMVDTSLFTKMLSSSDKLRILDYLIEYESLKTRLATLSFDELNRFMFLGDYLSKYFSADDLGMSKELLNKTLEQFGKVSNVSSGDISNNGKSKNILENFNIGEKVGIKENIEKMKKEILSLYNNNKISAYTYEKVLEKLGDIEYKISLPETGSKEISVDLDDISNILNMEKSSYSLDADLSAFSNFDEILLDVQKSVDSISYISDFLNGNMASIDGIDGAGTDVYLDNYSSKIGNVLNNVDVDAFSDLLDFVGEDRSGGKAKQINFSKTMSLPKVTVEGTIEDAWNINLKNFSGVNFSNVLNPIDTSLISSDYLKNQLNSIVNVKVPDLDLTKISNPGSIVKPQEPNDTDNQDSSSNPEKEENPNNSNEQSKQSGGSDLHIYDIIKNNFKKIMLAFFVSGVCVLILVFINKNRRKIGVKEKEYYEDFMDKEFNISKDMSKSYKQRLIEEGAIILDMVSKKYLKENKMMTPREVVSDFVKAYPDCNEDECNKFLRYFEESTFYNLEVDENIYIEFNNLCKSIFAFANVKGGNHEKVFW